MFIVQQSTWGRRSNWANGTHGLVRGCIEYWGNRSDGKHGCHWRYRGHWMDGLDGKCWTNRFHGLYW